MRNPRATSLGVPAGYLALALLVAGPVLGGGLVLAIDLAQTPRSPIPDAYWGLPTGTNEGSLGRLPIDAFFALLGSLDLVAVGQKALLVAITLLAGLGMHRLVAARTLAAGLFAGALYAVNPFVLDRLLTGQWLLLLAYALIPWALAAFLAALRRGARLAPWAFALIVALMGSAGAHMAVLALALCVLVLLMHLRSQDASARRGLLAIGLAVLASLAWLIPTPGLEELWRSVGDAQLGFYATRPDATWGPLVTVAGLHGNWNLPAELTVGGVLFAAALVVLAIRGFVLRAADPVARAVAVAGVAGFFFALGMSTGVTRPIFTWLLETFPALRAFREPQKAVALVVLAYAFLGAAAIDDIAAHQRRGPGRLAVGVLAAGLVLLAGGRQLWGASDRLHPVSFPASWSAADEVLEREATGSRTLFLPFHGYLNLRFARSRVVFNPAPGFFSTPLLTSRSVAEGEGLDDAVDRDTRAVAALLDRGPGHQLARCLQGLGVSHVLLAHEADWRTVKWVEREPGFRVLRRSDDLTLLALEQPGAFAMTAPTAARGGCPSGLAVLPSHRVSPVTLKLRAPVPADRRLVLGLPAAQAWDVEDGRARFSRWPAYRRVYLAAAAGWLLVLASGGVLLVRGRRPAPADADPAAT